MRTRKALGEPLLEGARRLLWQVLGDDHLVRQLARLVIVLGEELAHEVRRGHVEALVENEVIADDDAPVAHDEDMSRGDGLFAEEADDIDVERSREHRLLLFLQRLDGLEAIARAGRVLEVELGRRLLHLGLELAHELVALAGEKALDTGDERCVFLGRDGRAAWTGALADVVGETRLVICRGPSARLDHARHLAVLLAGHGADGHDAPHGIDGLARRARIGIGPEVARAAPVLLTRELDGGIGGAFGNGDEGIALIIAIVDVEGRIVLLDEVLLENERFGLVVHHDVIEGGNLLHHERNLETLVLS